MASDILNYRLGKKVIKMKRVRMTARTAFQGGSGTFQGAFPPPNIVHPPDRADVLGVK